MMLSNLEINHKLNFILSELGHEKYLVNPYFRISKATPEQMHKYRDLKYGFQRSRILFYLLLSIPVNIGRILFFIFLSFIFINQNRIFSKHIDRAEYIFLSHGIGQNIHQIETDQFFGVIPAYLSGKKRNVATIYTNHHRLNFKNYSKLNLLNKKGIKKNLLPKFLKPTENLSYLKTIVVPSLNCLIKGFKKFRSDPDSAYLLIKSGILFYGRATYSNYLLLKRIEDAITKSNPNFLILTFEGHSYEQYILENVFSNHPEINLVLYQHSPIVPDHYGVESFLRSYKNKIVITVTGKKYIEIFSKISLNPIYRIVGTSKALKIAPETNRNPSKTVLFTPEGTKWATYEYLRLIQYLSARKPNLNFCLRLHPNLKQSIIIKILIRWLNKKHNFSLSKNDLYTDLQESTFVVYRSSAVGIESLKFNVTPIFYGASSQSGLNVLSYNPVVQLDIDSPSKFLNFLDLKSEMLSKSIKNKIYSELFEPVQYSELNNLFNLS